MPRSTYRLYTEFFYHMGYELIQKKLYIYMYIYFVYRT